MFVCSKHLKNLGVKTYKKRKEKKEQWELCCVVPFLCNLNEVKIALHRLFEIFDHFAIYFIFFSAIPAYYTGGHSLSA